MYAYAHLVTYSIFFEIHHDITLPNTSLWYLEICWKRSRRGQKVLPDWLLF